MVWFKVDDGFWSHPKVLELSDSAIALWTRAGAYCAGHLTDGDVKRSTLRVLAADRDAATELVIAGLWDERDDGWSFHDWCEYQPTREEVLKERAAAAERKRVSRERSRMRSQGESRGESHRDVQGSHTVSHASPTRPDPTRPDPTEVEKKNTPPKAEEFEKFWSAYPRKEGKGDARKAFAAARKKTDLATILDGLRRYKLATVLTEKQFVKMPGPWLRAERWDDEQVAIVSTPTGPLMCFEHDGYPLPCAKCDREGNRF